MTGQRAQQIKEEINSSLSGVLKLGLPAKMANYEKGQEVRLRVEARLLGIQAIRAISEFVDAIEAHAWHVAVNQEDPPEGAEPE
jgi:hypothetical protein